MSALFRSNLFFTMHWINLRTDVLRSEPYINTSLAGRGTWLSVLGYCYEQENGGRIPGGGAWPDRRWLQTCGVTLAEIKKAPRLLVIDGTDIVCHGYPVEKDAEMAAKRQGGADGAAKRWARRTPDALPNGSAIPIAFASANAERERKGKGTEPQNPPPRASAEPGGGESAQVLAETASLLITLCGGSGKKEGRALSYEATEALTRQRGALPLSSEDLATLAAWLALPEDPKNPFLRAGSRPRDASRLAIRLFDELDRARAHFDARKKKTPAAPADAPARWREAAVALWGEAGVKPDFSDYVASLQIEIRGWIAAHQA